MVVEINMRSINSQQIDKNTTKQIRIDAGLHKIVKILAANEQRTIKGLIEESLADFLPNFQRKNNE